MFISTRSFRYKCNLRNFPSFPSFSVSLLFRFRKAEIRSTLRLWIRSESTRHYLGRTISTKTKNISINVQKQTSARYFRWPAIQAENLSTRIYMKNKRTYTRIFLFVSSSTSLLSSSFFDYNWKYMYSTKQFNVSFVSPWFRKYTVSMKILILVPFQFHFWWNLRFVKTFVPLKLLNVLQCLKK